MYDEFFDFNGDGKVDVGKEYCAMKIFEECIKEDSAPQYYTNYQTTGKKKISGWEWFWFGVLIFYVLCDIIGL